MPADVSRAEADRFSAAFTAHAAHLHDYCRFLLAKRLDAADAAQTTLVIAHAMLDRLQDTGRVRAWLLAIARRECRSADPVRAQLPHSIRDRGWAQGGTAGEPATEELRLPVIAGRGVTAGAMLNRLPASQREVLELVYRHHLSSADVAAVLGVSADRASALLADAIASFERARQSSAAVSSTHDSTADTSAADVRWHAVQRAGNSEALVAGIRVISAIPLVALPPSILDGATRIALSPEFATCRERVASVVGDLGPDGFPAPPEHLDSDPERPQPVRQGALRQKAALLMLVPGKASRVPRRRLVLVGALLAALGAAITVMASSSSGVPITRAIGQTFGQMDPLRVRTRGPTPALPITSLLPEKQHQGSVLPILPVPSPTASHKSHRAPPTGTPSPTPSPAPTSPGPSPTATPTSPSPTPTSPSPSSPSPTPTVTP